MIIWIDLRNLKQLECGEWGLTGFRYKKKTSLVMRSIWIEYEWKKRDREFYAMDAEETYSLLENIAEINGLQEKLHRFASSKIE